MMRCQNPWKEAKLQLLLADIYSTITGKDCDESSVFNLLSVKLLFQEIC